MNKFLILSAMALLLPIVPALACFPDNDKDEDEDNDEVLFTSEQRTSAEDCQANGLNPGSYFDEKGRIVGSPCDPVEYCNDRSSTDIAVIDYCGDSWDEQEPIIDECGEGEELFEGKCQIIATNPVCPHECGPTPEPEPEPIEDEKDIEEEPEPEEDEPSIEEDNGETNE